MRTRIFGLLLFVTAAAHAEITVLAGGRLIDGYGGPPIENAVVVIDGNTMRLGMSTPRRTIGSKSVLMPSPMLTHDHRLPSAVRHKAPTSLTDAVAPSGRRLGQSARGPLWMQEQ